MIVWKITDSSCPVCAEMGQFDQILAFGLGWNFNAVSFEDAHSYPKLWDYMRLNLLAEDGTVDIPIYIVESSQGTLKGAVQGSNTKSELHRKFLQIAE